MSRRRSRELAAIEKFVKRRGITAETVPTSMARTITLPTKSKTKYGQSIKRPFEAVMPNGQKRFYRTHRIALTAQRAAFKDRKEEVPIDGRNVRNGPVKPESPKLRKFQFSPYSFYERTNSAEQRFLRYAATKSLRVHRNGWPDFFCENPDGGTAAVEVKNGIDDPLRPEQVTCMKMLSDAGIETFIWNRARSKHMNWDALIPWRDYVSPWKEYDSKRPEMDSGAKATRQATTSADSDLCVQAHANPVSENGRIPEVLGDPRTVH